MVHIWSYMAIYGHIWTYMAHIWPYMIIYGHKLVSFHVPEFMSRSLRWERDTQWTLSSQPSPRCTSLCRYMQACIPDQDEKNLCSCQKQTTKGPCWFEFRSMLASCGSGSTPWTCPDPILTHLDRIFDKKSIPLIWILVIAFFTVKIGLVQPRRGHRKLRLLEIPYQWCVCHLCTTLGSDFMFIFVSNFRVSSWSAAQAWCECVCIYIYIYSMGLRPQSTDPIYNI